MSTSQPPITTYTYPDRSTRLVLLGVFQLMLGGLFGLLAATMVAVSLKGPFAQAQQGSSMNGQVLFFALAFYLPLAAVFIGLGIGLIRARRWAWTLTVVVSWMWLITGVVGLVALGLFMRESFGDQVAQQGKIPPGAAAMMQIVVLAISGCFYVLLPAMFIALCRGKSVWATCERRDPKIPWTDRCPMPVLALSIIFAISIMSLSLSMVNGSVIPLFGVFLSGTAGSAVILLIAAALAYLAWGTYRLRMDAWWGALLLGIVGTLNGVVTFSRNDLMRMYEKMEMPAEQLEMIRKSGIVESMNRWGPWMGLVAGAAWLGYLLYVRRYFVRAAEETTITS